VLDNNEAGQAGTEFEHWVMQRLLAKRVIQRLLAKRQAMLTELRDLKKTYAGSVSLRCQSLNDQCDLLEEILGIPLSYPRGSQEDR